MGLCRDAARSVRVALVAHSTVYFIISLYVMLWQGISIIVIIIIRILCKCVMHANYRYGNWKENDGK